VEDRLAGRHVAPGRGVHHGRDQLPPVPVPAGRAEQRELADLGLPAAPGATPARLAARVDDHVADLAAVPAVSGDRTAAGDDAASDRGVTVQVDNVVAADGDAPGVLGEGA